MKAVSGRHPFAGGSAEDVVERIRHRHKELSDEIAKLLEERDRLDATCWFTMSSAGPHLGRFPAGKCTLCAR